MEKLLSAKQVASVIGSNTDYVYLLLNSGLLPHIYAGAKKVLPGTLEEFLKKWEGWDITDPYNPKQLTQQ